MTGSPQPDWNARRTALVQALAAEGRLSDRALDAIGTVLRHKFVPPRDRADAYRNEPLPIGQGQTISQPFMVGWLVDAVHAQRGRRILEIGTGCGYQAAVLAASGAEVWSIEIRPELARRARATLNLLGLRTIQTRLGDGALGWPEAAPFDGIVLTAAPEKVPAALLEQVAEGGVLVAPVGPQDSHQELMRWTRGGTSAWKVERLGAVRFVPFVEVEGFGGAGAFDRRS